MTFLIVTDISWNVNTSTHQKTQTEKESGTSGILIYLIFSLLVITFILCLLYIRLLFRCRFTYS